MKYATMFFLGVTFTSLTPIEARQNLRVTSFDVLSTTHVDNACLIADGSFGTTSPGPRVSLGSCSSDYALDVEFEYWNNGFSYIKITDSNGNSGCMSHDNNWLVADICQQTLANNVWALQMGETLKGSDNLCVGKNPDAETASENIRMVNCDGVATTFALVDAPLVDAPFDCSVDFDTKPIDNFQLKTVGVSTSSLNLENLPSPVRSFVQKDALTVQFFYEGDLNYAKDPAFINVTLYEIGDEDSVADPQDPKPCNGNGVALIDDAGSAFYTVSPLGEYSDYNNEYSATSVDECFPQTTNGKVMQAEIVMRGSNNPFDTTAEEPSLASKIYDTDTGALGLDEGQDGRLQFCARIAYYIGDDIDAKELISYLDTKVVLDVSLSAEIEFTQSVDISSSDQTVNTVSQDVSTAIEVDSFLCGDPAGDNGGAPYAEDYSLGQAFRVCVDVKTDDQDKFRLANFKEVTCSPDTTDSESTTIIRLDEGNSEPTVTSILTSLFDNAATEGAKSFDSQTVASAQAISFSTVLTNAYFTGEAETLACTGSVDVETVSTDAPVGFATLNLYCNDFAIGYNNYHGNTGDDVQLIAEDYWYLGNQVYNVCYKDDGEIPFPVNADTVALLDTCGEYPSLYESIKASVPGTTAAPLGACLAPDGAVAPITAFATGQEFCDDFVIGYETPMFWFLYSMGTSVCCEDQPCSVEAQLTYCAADPEVYDMTAAARACVVPDAALNQERRRQLVSFTVPNPMASSSASSRRRMDEETGAAAADFGAIIKLSSSSSSSSFAASGPFLLLLWATITTTLLLLSAGWSL